MDKYIKKGNSKYPQKSGQKGREGEDQPSPKLEVTGSVPRWGTGVGVYMEKGEGL